MPTESSATKSPAPRRRRFRWRRVVLAFLVTAVVLMAAVVILANNLTPVAVWMLERSFPGATVEISKLGFQKFGRLDADAIVLKSRKDGETLLTLAGGTVEFNFDDLRRFQVGEVRLVQPVIHASPRLMDAFAPPPGTPAKKAGRPWSVRRLVCDYGEANISDYGVSKLTVRSKFAFDFQNFSPANAAEKMHEFVLWDFSASIGNQPAFVTLAKGTVAFNFAGFNQGEIAEIRLTQPVVHASPGLINNFTAKPGEPPAKASLPWNVKKLSCDFGEINIADYGSRGLWLRSKFAFDFEDFSPAKAPEKVHRGVIWDFTAAAEGKEPFLTLDLVRVGFSFDSLLKKKTWDDISLQGGSLVVGDQLRKLVDNAGATTAQPATMPPPPAQPWVVGALDIRKLAIRIDDDRPGVTDLAFELNTTLQELPLSQAASSLAAEGQLIEIANFEAVSPRDPLTKVLSVDSIFVRFTLGGLLRKEISEFQIVGPTIYLGEDLFIYMEDMEKQLGLKKSAGETAPNPASDGWVIKKVLVRYGKLSIGSGGKKQYGLPLEFRAVAYDVPLDNLAALQLRNAILEIPAQNYVFESYQLEFTSEKGQLHFSYPPEKGEKNVVGDIKLKTIRWRQYESTDAYLSVTFDRQGINGLFGGQFYKGQVDGGFSFFFDSTSPWIGWCAGERIDLKKLTNVISPQNFQMTGPMNFKLQMDAQGRNIDRILGEFQTPKPGKMVIGKLDDLLGRIPPTWNLLKQSSTKIALETLRDFEYATGKGNFWFVESQGILQLQLQGPLGSRNFDIVLHTNDSPEGRWKQDSTKR